jgi:hypothetical protein
MRRAKRISVRAQFLACAMLAGLLFTGCGKVELTQVAPAAKPALASPVTFNKEIAPLVWKNCASCHRPGEAAPFSLLTYEDVRRRAEQIVEVTQDRYMP